MNKITMIVVLVVSFFALFTKNLQAITLFYDNFDNQSLVKWEKSIGDTSWSIVNGRLYGENYRQKESNILALGTQNLSDFVFTADVENQSGMDQHYLFRINEARDTYYQLELRYGERNWNQIDVNSIRLWKFVGGNYFFVKDIPFVISQDQIHNLKIVFLGSRIQVYLDSYGLLLDWTDPNPILSGSFGLHNYSGDFGPAPTKNFFDNILITDGVDDILQPRNKIIIIPGLGASWSEEGMVFGRPANDWRMTPFVKNYNGLISAFEGVGLTKNSNFFVWNYDWRKPIEKINEDFNDFVVQKIGTSGKVDIVGHSLGGVVGRTWAQKHLDSVGKVITLGSPHEGSVSAYDAWAGGKISDKFDAFGIAMNVLLQLQKRSFESPVETIRNKVKVLKDLLPTFDFLRKEGIVVTSFEANDFLKSYNSLIGFPNDWLKMIAGVGINTKSWIDLGGRNLIYRAFNIWPDGRPVGYFYNDGDGTVLRISSGLNGNEYQQIDSNHGEIVDKSINNILSILDIGSTYSGGVAGGDFKNNLVFYIGSPAKIGLNCDGENVGESIDFLIVENKYKNCTLSVIGNETGGEYHLVYGLTDDEKGWGYVENQIGVGETQNWNFQIVKNSLKTANNTLLLKQMIKNLLGQIDTKTAKEAILSLDREKWSKLVEQIFKIRREGQLERSRIILDNLVMIFENDSQIKNRIEIKLAKEIIKLNISQR